MNDQLALLSTAAGTGALLITAGWLLLHLARRAARGALKRNQLAGIRTSVTLSSDAAWQAAHVAAESDSVRGAQGLIVGGVAAGVSGLLALTGLSFPITATTFTLITLGSTAWLLIWTLRGAAVGQKAAAQITAKDQLVQSSGRKNTQT